ncbi:metal ABC transporter solute-binding protein [Lentilactobacillus buchneri]|uniref:ABC-type metal ion transport system, periplasmic component n=1 Tax=Lentilactobacillus buchneri subsp. silagei CD034 TaxID=1071400 RepID=J9W0W1_LENBU|nr:MULTISPECIES: metal ABC transporter solute-binding protein [Lentilactobacillus]MCC6100832.1 metal ABC transporter solute-binding protein [Lactobacillus sp.]AFR99346.1 ABC-type metal ion transport system, periplasmic component [Lentilactobacillus buchneri subsp. silagei CD034]MCT2900777.1 metal ABC transporter substrate-binding protein [Lentilactobacillus buchneri]MCT3541387.1 metal ABC transporter substrate-binding protein [Lentilactobacillus buchneri]MCT3546044.1 metal ABC transporter subs
MLHKFSGFKAWLLVVVAVALGIGLTGCASNSASNGKIKITATTDFYGEVAKAVVGSKGDVTSIITNPNVDPHDYQASTKVAKETVGSKIVIANGIGYDGWMNNLVKDSSKVDYIKVGEDLMGKQNGDNPHLWYNPATMPKLANTIATKLGKLQPKNKAYFKKNAQKYIASLKPVNDKIAQLKQLAATKKNKEVYVSEPVFDYALEATGFKVGDTQFENDTEKGVDPSPQTIRTMQNGIKNHKIAFFVFNKQVDSKTVNNLVALAKQNKVPVLPVTETLPANKTYVSWMDSQYTQLINILK